MSVFRLQARVEMCPVVAAVAARRRALTATTQHLHQRYARAIGGHARSSAYGCPAATT
jgi:hypothetical protein